MSLSLATRTQWTILFVVPGPGSEVLLFISISQETTERECWWFSGGAKKHVLGMRKVAHMYLAITTVDQDPRVKESTTVQQSCPFTNPIKWDVVLTALKVQVGNEVHHHKTELNRWTRVWWWAVRVGVFGIGDGDSEGPRRALDYRCEFRCVSNSYWNFAIADDEQTQLGDSARNETSASVDRSQKQYTFSIVQALQLEWNIVQIHNPTYSR